MTVGKGARRGISFFYALELSLISPAWIKDWQFSRILNPFRPFPAWIWQIRQMTPAHKIRSNKHTHTDRISTWEHSKEIVFILSMLIKSSMLRPKTLEKKLFKILYCVDCRLSKYGQLVLIVHQCTLIISVQTVTINGFFVAH